MSAGIGGPTRTVSADASAAAEALAIDSAEIVNADIATVPAGSIIRSNGVALQFVRALFDTSANAGGIIGTLTQDVPVGGSIRVNGIKTMPFDSAPTVGLTAYGSVTGLGQATCSVPSSSAVMVPLGTVIAVLAGNKGMVACPTTGLFSQGALEDILHAETVALLGGDPGRWDVRFDHFNKLPGASRIPQWGNVSYAATPDNPSCVKMGPKDGHTASWYFLGSQAELFLTSKLMESVKAMFSASVQFDAAARVACFVFGGTNDTLYIGVIDGSTIEAVIVNDGGSTWASGTPSAGQRQTLGTVVAGTKARIDLLMYGDGTFSARGPSGVWTAPKTLGNAAWAYSNFSWANANNGGAVELDWVFSDIYR